MGNCRPAVAWAAVAALAALAACQAGRAAERSALLVPPAGGARWGVAWRERSTGRTQVGPVSDGQLGTAAITAARMRAAGFARVRLAVLAPDGSGR